MHPVLPLQRFRPAFAMTRPTLDLVAAVLALVAGLLAAGPVAAQPAVVPTVAQTVAAPVGSARAVSLGFTQLGVHQPLRLNPLDGGQTVPFSVRADEVVTQLRLRLDLRFAAGLPLQQAHIRVLLNDESVATLPIEAGAEPARMLRDVALDPSVLTDFNRLGLQLILPREQVCERIDRSGLWARVSEQSSLTLTVEPLPVANDLALLPAPFFDRRDNRRLDLNVVLPSGSSAPLLRSAGALASWFGAHASYRGAQFHSVSAGAALPPGHAIVLATPQERPAGLNLPPILGPTVSVVDHPGQPNAKLLLVLGRNADELQRAVEALSLGQLTLSGSSAQAGPPPQRAARRPYDAPNWVATDRPVRFDELASAESLSVKGPHPESIRFALRLPPDLHFVRQDSVPLDLRWRFTPPASTDRSALSLGVNGNQMRGFALPPAQRWRWPDGIERTSEGDAQVHGARVRIPGGLINRQPVSEVALRFNYDAPVDDPCSGQQAAGSQLSSLDGSSTLDFSGVPHFMRLPDLAVFANAGFPFSRLADLSETAVLLPTAPSAIELDTYLNLMGHLGRSTGYPALAVAVGSAADVQAHADRDLVLIGSAARQPLLQHWAQHLPLQLAGVNQGAVSTSVWQQLLQALTGREAQARPTFQQNGGGAALLGFESPLSAGRSVLALTANQTEQLGAVSAALLDAAQISRMHGQVTLIEADGQMRSFDAGSSYYVGDVGLFDRLRFILAHHPLWLLALLALVAVTLSWACAIGLRRLARRRLGTSTAAPSGRPAP